LIWSALAAVAESAPRALEVRGFASYCCTDETLMRGGLALRDCLEHLLSAVNGPSPKKASNERPLAVGSKVRGGESPLGTDRCQQRADAFSAISVDDINAL